MFFPTKPIIVFGQIITVFHRKWLQMELQRILFEFHLYLIEKLFLWLTLKVLCPYYSEEKSQLQIDKTAVGNNIYKRVKTSLNILPIWIKEIYKRGWTDYDWLSLCSSLLYVSFIRILFVTTLIVGSCPEVAVILWGDVWHFDLKIESVWSKYWDIIGFCLRMSLGIALIIEQRGSLVALRIADYHGSFLYLQISLAIWQNYQFSMLKKQNFSLKSALF